MKKMVKEMNKFAIVSKQDKPSETMAAKIREEVSTFMTYDEAHPELVIAVGGDGTILYAVHKYLDQLETIQFVGIHTGTLGFFTDYKKDEVNDMIHDIKTKTPHVFDRALLEVHSHGQIHYALNEMRLENNRHSQVIDVYINEEHLETFRGNGLCVSTPSGSTAYNKSIQGAVLDPSLQLMQLSEIAGINHNAYRSLGSSLILGSDKYIRLKTVNYEHSVMCCDIEAFELMENEVVDVMLSKRVARFADYRQVNFIDRLKKSFL